MNLVVSFLSMLNSDKENGGVKRMLGVCAEFERIAKVVLDKAEKEAPRRKRKAQEEDPKAKGPTQTSPASSQTPWTQHGPIPMASVLSSIMANTMNAQNGLSPMDTSGSPSSGQWDADFASDNGYMAPNGTGMAAPFSDVQGYTNGVGATPPLDLNTFQQPFVPQDLWQMPMTLEWDWANMSGEAYSGFENGIADDTNLHNNGQPLQPPP
jgi:hypothetical protein